ncbi:MAG: GTPase HflX [Candidatus Saganbacteria bacterium]|nr:GTPase HflX [Candidatus Saganbacteria bacterium]
MDKKETAVLAGVRFRNDRLPIEDSILELSNLAETAGARVTGSVTQPRESPDIKYFIGKGKLDDLLLLINDTGSNLVIFDNELKPSQVRELEKALGVKVIDRTELILDIFSQHAHSHEGRLQVELAQSQYMMTRLTGKGIAMSRLGGGIGTRGPGETKLEEDRRKIRKKISELKKEIEKIRESRQMRRKNRQGSGILMASIIGYTNAGKSTLLNSLTKAGVLVEDKLFATLDTTTRKLYLDENNSVLLSDTVGFIQKLPHQLVDAFRATLEEVAGSDFLIHVVDLSSAVLEEQIASVFKVLEDIGAIGKPILTVFNKSDLVKEGPPESLLKKYAPYVKISALKKEGFESLRSALKKMSGEVTAG